MLFLSHFFSVTFVTLNCVAVSNRLCKLEAISALFIAAISQGFRTCSKLDANMLVLLEISQGLYGS